MRRRLGFKGSSKLCLQRYTFWRSGCAAQLPSAAEVFTCFSFRRGGRQLSCQPASCRLMASFAARLTETTQTWARLVAPFAEWVAQTLWNRSSSATLERQIATRLTQRRKTEGRGKTFAPKQVSMKTPLKVCSICGVESASGEYCSACAAIHSRENMTLAAFKWHSTPQNTRAKKRAAQLQSDHAVAISWWSPSSLPTWLNDRENSAST